MKTYVLDATPLLSGYTPNLTNAQHYTTKLIFEEIKTSAQVMLRIDSPNMKVRDPSARFTKQAMDSASASGDLFSLSKADISLLALSLELKSQDRETVLITDDYSIQNVASQLGIEFMPYLWKGIRRRYGWTVYCPSCGKRYNASRRICENCGSPLKRKATKRGNHHEFA